MSASGCRGPGAVAWRSSPTRSGLLLSEPAACRRCMRAASAGVSLRWLTELSEALLVSANADGAAPPSTREVVSALLLPYTRKAACRLFDALPSQYTGQPSLCVVHAWDAPFMLIVDQLTQYLGCSSEDTFVWLDFVALNLHPQGASAAPDTLPGNPSLVKELVHVCAQGALLILDKSMTPLNRTWCLYEVFCFAHADLANVALRFPSNLDLDDINKYRQLCYNILHQFATHTSTTQRDDRQHLLREIKQSVGLRLMQRELHDVLQLKLHATLRWSSSFQHQALHCVVLLQTDQLTRLQQVLHQMPGLSDDDMGADDIKDTFDLHADPESGLMQHDAFVALLSASGFDDDEAAAVFAGLLVNEDGNARGKDGAALDLDTFTAWATCRASEAQSLRLWRPPSMTVRALLRNLDMLEGLLKLKGHASLAAKLHASASDLRAGRLTKHGVLASGRLPSSGLKADVAGVLDLTTQRMLAGDHSAALAALHSFLLWNADVLHRDPRELTRPAAAAARGVEGRCEALSHHLKLFGIMLWEVAGLHKQGEHFQRQADQLRKPEMVAQIVRQQQELADGHRQLHAPAEATGKAMQHVLRSMISLKYGQDKPVDHQLLAEAEVAVSQWRTQPCDHAVRYGHKQLVRQQIQVESADYMLHQGAPSENAKSGESILTKLRSGLSRAAGQEDDKDSSVLLRMGGEAAEFYNSHHPPACAKQPREDTALLTPRAPTAHHAGGRADALMKAAASSPDGSPSIARSASSMPSLSLLRQGGALGAALRAGTHAPLSGTASLALSVDAAVVAQACERRRSLDRQPSTSSRGSGMAAAAVPQAGRFARLKGLCRSDHTASLPGFEHVCGCGGGCSGPCVTINTLCRPSISSSMRRRSEVAEAGWELSQPVEPQQRSATTFEPQQPFEPWQRSAATSCATRRRGSLDAMLPSRGAMQQPQHLQQLQQGSQSQAASPLACTSPTGSHALTPLGVARQRSRLQRASLEMPVGPWQPDPATLRPPASMHLSADSNVLVDAYTCHSQYFDTDASPVRGHSCHGSHGHQHGRRSHSPHRVRQHQQRAEHKHTALEHATDGSLLTLANAGQPSPVVDVST